MTRAYLCIVLLLAGCAPSLQQLIDEERWDDAELAANHGDEEDRAALRLARMERTRLRVSLRALSASELVDLAQGPVPDSFTVVEVQTVHEPTGRSYVYDVPPPTFRLSLRDNGRRTPLMDRVSTALRNERVGLRNPDHDLTVIVGRGIDSAAEYLDRNSPDGPSNPGAEAAARRNVRRPPVAIDPIEVLNERLSRPQCEAQGDEIHCTMYRMLDAENYPDERPAAVLLDMFGNYALPLRPGADLATRLSQTFTTPIQVGRAHQESR